MCLKACYKHQGEGKKVGARIKKSLWVLEFHSQAKGSNSFLPRIYMLILNVQIQKQTSKTLK